MAELAGVFKAGAQQRRLVIDPDENILIGMKTIMRYLGVKSATTLVGWVEVYGLPAIKRPDGQWMTSMTAIDNWIWLGAELDAQNRPFSRGSNQRWDLALATATRRAKRAQRLKSGLETGPIDTLFKTPEQINGSEDSAEQTQAEADSQGTP